MSDQERQQAPRRAVRRERRANVLGGRVGRHVVKVSASEEAALVARARAAGVTVPRLLVESALVDDGGLTATEQRELIVELFAVRRLMAGIATNVNQMAKATNATGEVQENMYATFEAVRRVVERVDNFVHEIGPIQ